MHHGCGNIHYQLLGRMGRPSKTSFAVVRVIILSLLFLSGIGILFCTFPDYLKGYCCLFGCCSLPLSTRARVESKNRKADMSIDDDGNSTTAWTYYNEISFIIKARVDIENGKNNISNNNNIKKNSIVINRDGTINYFIENQKRMISEKKFKSSEEGDFIDILYVLRNEIPKKNC